MLTEAEHDQLTCLAAALEVSRGAAVRKSIAHHAGMLLKGVPTCADGRRCFVPQMHAPAPNPLETPYP